MSCELEKAKKKTKRLEHHMAGLQQTVFDLQDSLALKDEIIFGLREEIAILVAKQGLT